MISPRIIDGRERIENDYSETRNASVPAIRENRRSPVSTTLDLADLFSPNGELAARLTGFSYRAAQQEMARLIQKELGKSISQSYLSQIEKGTRPHLTNSTRMLLAKFFKVHPGYLVDDPEGYQTELVSDVVALEDKVDLWLISGAERFCVDPELHQALLTVSKHNNSRMCLVLLGEILENPGLAERLMEVLKTPAPAPKPKSRRRS